jgi:outer membrane autotransporter protein
MNVTSTLTLGSAESEQKISGGGAMFEAVFGGTVAPGFVLGAALIGHAASEPTVEIDGNEQTAENTTLQLSTLGLLAQYYFDPKSGFYVQALIGLGTANSRYDANGISVESKSSSGIALGVGAGYDFWIGDQWSMGPEFRVLYANMKYEGSDTEAKRTDEAVVPTLALTFTLH